MSRRRQSHRAQYHQYCARVVGLPCIHGPTVHHAECEIMGPTRGFSADMIEQALAAVRGAAPADLDAIRDRMRHFGECLWHACARVWSKPCSCAACSNPKDPRHPWLITDPADKTIGEVAS